ncbi:hypothetical protein EHV23_00390 [Lautropia dentalis]|uniref:Uncharacterized protein n=1 Tax=Lautropia dentalis TaxID=2490857 RepID=A0A426FPZ5_9BURK|nr:hypothetical protein [Lautropia dentalis]RRN44792.1 hypothetical protein EHV23_00390 [Lautropia dentalis]
MKPNEKAKQTSTEHRKPPALQQLAVFFYPARRGRLRWLRRDVVFLVFVFAAFCVPAGFWFDDFVFAVFEEECC